MPSSSAAGAELDVAEAVDDVQRDLAVGHGRRERPALARGDDRIVAAVHQDELERQLRQIAPREVERLEISADPRRQSVDQRRHPLRVGVVEQRHHRAALGTEARPQIGDVGREIRRACAPRSRRAPPVGGIGQPRGVGPHEHPLAVGVGRAMAPRRLGPLAVVAGGEEGHHGRDVVVAADRGQIADEAALAGASAASSAGPAA